MFSEEQRTNILNNFLENIWGISNKAYQVRVWINGLGPEVDDYTETTCRFFEVVDSIIEESSDYNLTEHQIELIKNLKQEFEEFNDNPMLYWTLNFIDTPKWEQVRQKAKLVVEEFHYQHRPFVPVSDTEQSSRDS